VLTCPIIDCPALLDLNAGANARSKYQPRPKRAERIQFVSAYSFKHSRQTRYSTRLTLGIRNNPNLTSRKVDPRTTCRPLRRGGRLKRKGWAFELVAVDRGRAGCGTGHGMWLSAEERSRGSGEARTTASLPTPIAFKLHYNEPVVNPVGDCRSLGRRN
jgi:hypothetical protein